MNCQDCGHEKSVHGFAGCQVGWVPIDPARKSWKNSCRCSVWTGGDSENSRPVGKRRAPHCAQQHCQAAQFDDAEGELMRDTNGTPLKKGDYVLSTGDGLGIFPIEHWRAGRVESDGCMQPLPFLTDGTVERVIGPFDRNCFKISRESAIAFAADQGDVRATYDARLAAHRAKRRLLTGS